MPSYVMQDTGNENIKRFVDRDGEWSHYFIVDENKFVPGVTFVLSCGYPKGPRFYDWLKNNTADEADSKFKSAGERGTRTHEAIHMLIAGAKVSMSTKLMNSLTRKQEELSVQEWDNLIGFNNWQEKYKPETISQNLVIYSKKLGFVGTPDWFGTVFVPEDDKYFPSAVRGQRVLFLPDWKSSSGIWPEYQSQVAAYFTGLQEMGLFKEFFTAFKGKIFTGVVRVGTRHKDKYEMKVWGETETASGLMRFLSAYSIAEEDLRFEPKIVDIPMEFEIDIPKATVPKVVKKKRVIKKKAVVEQSKIVK